MRCSQIDDHDSCYEKTKKRKERKNVSAMRLSGRKKNLANLTLGVDAAADETRPALLRDEAVSRAALLAVFESAVESDDPREDGGCTNSSTRTAAFSRLSFAAVSAAMLLLILLLLPTVLYELTAAPPLASLEDEPSKVGVCQCNTIRTMRQKTQSAKITREPRLCGTRDIGDESDMLLVPHRLTTPKGYGQEIKY